MGGSRLAQVKELLEESLRINRTIGLRLEIARCLWYLGSIANSQAEFATAQEFLEESLAISQDIGHSLGLRWSLGGLGTTALGLGNLAAARKYFKEALEIDMTPQDIPFILDTLISMAGFILHVDAAFVSGAPDGGKDNLINKITLAIEIMTLVINHPATWQIYKDKAMRQLIDLESEFQPDITAGAKAQAKIKTLEDIVIEIITDL